MNKIILCFVVLFLYSCSKDESNPKMEIVEIFPSDKVIQKGDTIIIKGDNLEEINNFRFSTKNEVKNIAPFYVSDDEVKVIVPKLDAEKVNFIFSPNSSDIQNIPFRMVGAFFITEIFDTPLGNVDMVSDEIIYMSGAEILYKSIDGGYNWIVINSISPGINDIHFLNENQGWIASRSKLYYTIDGGKTFNVIFSLEESPYIEYLSGVHFNDLNNGYVLTSRGRVYETDDNLAFNLAYTYPGNNDDISFRQFGHLSVYNNSLLAFGMSGPSGNDPILIKKQNNNYSYSLFNSSTVFNIQLVDDNVGYINGGVFKLYLSEDLETWAETSTTMPLDHFYFRTKEHGIGISSLEHAPGPNESYYRIYETFDGGKNWTKIFETIYYVELCRDIDFYGKSAIIVGSHGHIRKYTYK